MCQPKVVMCLHAIAKERHRMAWQIKAESEILYILRLIKTIASEQISYLPLQDNQVLQLNLLD